MRSAVAKEFFRSIAKNRGRFLAILGIVALGCGFYAGLNMTGTDMRADADAYYDGTHLYDIRVVSTLGLDQDQLDQIAAVDGVESVMGDYSLDVMATVGDAQGTFRISSLDVDAAKASSADELGRTVSSDDANYINRLVLAEGEWPDEADECVVSADRTGGASAEIGDTIKVLYGTSDIDGVLTVREFTVVGRVHASNYMCSTSLGYTNLGQGTIEHFMYVPTSSFADDLPYTEAFVTVEGATSYLSGSDEYQAKVDEVQERIEDCSGDLAVSRLATVTAEAQLELDERTEDFESEKADVESQLDEALSQLEEAREKLDAAAAEIAESEQELARGQEALAEARQTATSELASVRTTLEESQARIASATSELATQQAALDEQKATWEASQAAWQAQRASLVEGRDKSAQDKAALEAERDALDPAAADYAEQLAAITEEIAATETAIAQFDAAINQGDEELAGARATLDEAQARLDAARTTLAAQRAKLIEGWKSYYTQADLVSQSLAASQATLNAGASELAAGRQEYASGLIDYEEGLATFEESRTTADREFADAAQQLADAQADIDAIELPDVYVLDRTSNLCLESYQQDSVRIDNIAAVFPTIFFLVAALVALTTMTRMVEDDRIDIGTHKALGFSTSTITLRYVAYALAASLAGGILGILVLSQVLPRVIQSAYAIMYSVPNTGFGAPIDLGVSLSALGAGVGVTLLATWGAAAATLRESPAALMLPKAPKAGKRILLERIGPIWRHMSFSWKVTFRNLFRYKRRMAMTVVGIAGCTALLLTGLGLHDSIWDIIDNQFEGSDPILSYNTVVGLNSDATDDEIVAAEQALASEADSKGYIACDSENMQVGSSKDDDTFSISVVVPADRDAFVDVVRLAERTSGEAIAFDANSVVIDEKAATLLGVGVGDTIRIYDQDDIGNTVGKGYELTVTGVTENYVRHYLYLGEEAYQEATGRDVVVNELCASTDPARETEISDALHATGACSTISFNTEVIEMYRKSLSSVNMIVVVLVGAAGALAFIVLYNLTNINIVERQREIASLKVLGFTPREVAAYVFREVTLLVAIGAVVGLGFGVVLERFVVLSSEVDVVMFGREIHWPSFVWALATTMGFAALVMLAMLPKLRHIDMVESLKSVD